MKQKNFARFGLQTIFLLLIMQLVSAGVSHPLPTQLQLLKGESGRFEFQIQNLGKPDTAICTASLEDESLLIVEFDEEEMVVAGDSLKTFYGTVTVPKDYSPSSVGFDPSSEVYEQTFCVQCTPESTAPGASVNIRSCDLPINVKIVEVRTKENMYVSPKPKPSYPIGLIIGAVILVLIIIVMVTLKKKGHILLKKQAKPPRKK
jgi:hypothetical protein